MIDIVERLNRGEGCLEEGGKTCISMDAESGCLCAIAADEITRLRAEVERLNKSRNKWGQKYNKLLEEHKVTVSQLKAAVWSDSEECKLLTAENESLRAALEKICNGPRDADLDYLDLFVEVKMEARAALSGDKHE